MSLPQVVQPTETMDLSERARRRAALAALADRIRKAGGGGQDLRQIWRATSNRLVLADLWRTLCKGWI
jgi:hypothetical protein